MRADRRSVPVMAGLLAHRTGSLAPLQGLSVHVTDGTYIQVIMPMHVAR